VQQALNRYYETQINTATPEELTLMLYNGCIRFIKQAHNFMLVNDVNGKSQAISKAINIINELQATLNMDYEISKQLESLYIYFQERLLYVSIHLDQEALEEILGMITELRDTWHEAMKMVNKK